MSGCNNLPIGADNAIFTIFREDPMSVTAIVYAYSTERRAFPFPEYCEIFRWQPLSPCMKSLLIPITHQHHFSRFLAPGPGPCRCCPPAAWHKDKLTARPLKGFSESGQNKLGFYKTRLNILLLLCHSLTNYATLWRWHFHFHSFTTFLCCKLKLSVQILFLYTGQVLPSSSSELFKMSSMMNLMNYSARNEKGT